MILGISPGTANFAYVLLHNGKVIHWKTMYFRGKWSSKKLKRIMLSISKIIDQRGVAELAIKLPNKMPTSKGYTQMIGGLNRLVDGKKVLARYYAFEDIIEFLSPDTRITKQRMVEQLWHEYPEILAGTTIPKIVCNPNYIKLFEAVGASHVAVNSSQ